MLPWIRGYTRIPPAPADIGPLDTGLHSYLPRPRLYPLYLNKGMERVYPREGNVRW